MSLSPVKKMEVYGGKKVAPQKNKGGRPKVRPFVSAFKCVIDAAHPVGHAIIYTDADLLIATNRELRNRGKGEHQISKATFERWKKGETRVEELEEFRELYRESLLEQASNLFARLADKEEQRSWGRWAWIIERKFDEWNLRAKSVDETPDMGRLVMRVK